MAADERMLVRVDAGIDEHPQIETLSDKAFRGLFRAMFLSRDGYVDVDALPANVRDELWANGIMSAAGLLFIHGDLFRGPFRERNDRPRIPLELRQRVYERDGFRCVTCGADRPLSLDHVFPFSLGGQDTLENLQTMCAPCNSKKGARV